METTLHNGIHFKSSAIERVDYNPETKVLKVKHRNNNTIYDYPNFEAKDFAAFQAADSMGKHLAKHIKPKFAVRVK